MENLVFQHTATSFLQYIHYLLMRIQANIMINTLMYVA